jgi:hypothetical protein
MNDVTDAFEKMLSEGGPGMTRRPSFEKRCGIFYALYMSDKRGSGNKDRLTAATIARAFGITPAAASRLARALEPRHDGPNKFLSIKKEFERLGEQAFGEKYLTQDMHDAIANARRVPNPSGPNPASDSYEGFFNLSPGIVRVMWQDQPTKGWTYVACHSYDNIEEFAYIRERTSRAALVRAFGSRMPDELPAAISEEEALKLLQNIT